MRTPKFSFVAKEKKKKPNKHHENKKPRKSPPPKKNPSDTVETRLTDDPLNNPAKKYCWPTAQERIQLLFMSVLKRKGGFAFNLSLIYALKASPSFRSGDLHRCIKMSTFTFIDVHEQTRLVSRNTKKNPNQNPTIPPTNTILYSSHYLKRHQLLAQPIFKMIVSCHIPRP